MNYFCPQRIGNLKKCNLKKSAKLLRRPIPTLSSREPTADHKQNHYSSRFFTVQDNTSRPPTQIVD
jgi:hypothetical protein